MNTLDRMSTAVVVRPMPRPLIADDVTARVGHIPSIITKVGFSVIMPFFKRSVQEFIIHSSYSDNDAIKSNAPLTALVTARLVMVAPLIALTVPLSVLPEPSFTTESPLSPFAIPTYCSFHDVELFCPRPGVSLEQSVTRIPTILPSLSTPSARVTAPP